MLSKTKNKEDFYSARSKWVFRAIPKSPVFTRLLGLSDTKLSWRREWDSNFLYFR